MHPLLLSFVAYRTEQGRSFFPILRTVVLQALWALFPVAALAGLLAGWKARRLVIVATLGLLLTLFAVALAAQAADVRDADGWIDCWPGCSAFQVATGVGVTYVPAGGLLLAAAAIVLAFLRRG